MSRVDAAYSPAVTPPVLSNNREVSLMCVERIAYPVSEAANVVGRSRYVLYDAIKRKELPAYQQSERSDYLVLVEDLRAWVTRFPARPDSAEGSSRRRRRGAKASR